MRSVRLLCLCALALPVSFAAAASPPAHQRPLPRQTAVAAHLARRAAALESNPTWAATLGRVVGSVVSIDFSQDRAFDTDVNETAEATGFVVDAKRGIILTNRHVVTPGPVTATATFIDREQVPIYPIYYDPIHDFGFYRYNPKLLRYIHPRSLPLDPAGARVGREIRVIGNNAGEQLEILAGTLARLHRAAPFYGFGNYNDFNTFYLQAASDTSGGSSGSPVIDIRGQVVALNAGGAENSASSFYLPLWAVKRALKLIEAGRPVTRGTLYTVFHYLPFYKLQRLGLPAALEAAVRKVFPQRTGMLVVGTVLPGSPSARALQPGDILVRVNGHYVTTFWPLERILDHSVGRQVRLQLEQGGRLISVTLPVGDLDALTPKAYVQFGNAVVNTLSYEMALQLNVPPRGVWVANPGFVFGAAGVPRGAVIHSIDSWPIDNLRDFRRALAKLADGQYATVRFTVAADPNTTHLAYFRMDRRWFPAQYCVRDDKLDAWPCTALPPGPPSPPPPVSSTRFPVYRNPLLTRLAHSLVSVTFSMPYSVSGVTEHYYHGTGVVVDAKRGWVVVDRNTVPVPLGDVTVTFAGTLQVPGHVVYVSPIHNLAVVAYDPRLIGSTPVRTAKLTPSRLEAGEPVDVIGIGANNDLHFRATQISSIEPLELPLSRTGLFRDTNIESIQLVNPPDNFDGVLTDGRGDVLGLWSSFAFDTANGVGQDLQGVPIAPVKAMIERLHSGAPLHSLDVEFSMTGLSSARLIGLSRAWAARIAAHSGTRRAVLTVVRTVGGSPAQRLLEPGDLLLAVDGRVVTTFQQVARATANRTRVRLTIWRGAGALTLTVPTVVLSGTRLRRVLEWGGATLQAPFQSLLAQRGVPPIGVYVDDFAYGSPAARYGLYPGLRIVAVDGKPTLDFNAFLRAVSRQPNHASVRLTAIAWNNAPTVITLTLDNHYWPAYELLRTPSGWVRRALH